MVATTRDPASPVIIHSEERRGAAFTSSFDEEKDAVHGCQMDNGKFTGQSTHLFRQPDSPCCV